MIGIIILAYCTLYYINKEDFEKAIHFLEAAANSGHGKACALLSELYTTGSVLFCEDVVKPNPQRSFEWSLQGTENNDPTCLLKNAEFAIAKENKEEAELYLKKCLAVELDLVDSYSDKELSEVQSKAEKLLGN